MEYLSQTAAVESSLVRLQETRKKAVLSFERNTYLFIGTVDEFKDVKAWEMAEVVNKPELRRR